MKNRLNGATDVDVVGDIGADEPEPRVLDQVGDVGRYAREEVVEAHDVVVVGQESLT